MMRRRLITALALVAVGLLVVTLVGPASSASRKADLTVSDLAEPPETGAPGSTFRETFAVANQGARKARKKTTTRFFLDQTPDSASGRTQIGKGGITSLDGQDELSKRVRLRIPAGLASGEYFLVACADAAKKLKEAKEKNNCRISGQSIGVGLSRIGPQGPPGVTNEAAIDKFTLPIGRATVQGVITTQDFGDDEKSNQRREFAKVGPISLVADCKRTTNGDNGDTGDPETTPATPNAFDQNGDEAKILVYADNGTISFNGPGASSRRNIPSGEGAPEPNDPAASTQGDETNGGEGAHMALAAARDPNQTNPQNDWAFAYKVKTIYASHSNGTELILTAFAGIDVLGAEDQCVFGGVLKIVRLGA